MAKPAKLWLIPIVVGVGLIITKVVIAFIEKKPFEIWSAGIGVMLILVGVAAMRRQKKSGAPADASPKA